MRWVAPGQARRTLSRFARPELDVSAKSDSTIDCSRVVARRAGTTVVPVSSAVTPASVSNRVAVAPDRRDAELDRH